MHSRIRAYGVTLAALLALAVALPVGLSARPKPGVTPAGSFRLFGRSLGAATVNRIYCGLLSSGKVCADSTNSSTIPGGFWPKGTGNQYVFNSGMQFGGVIADANLAGGGDGGPFVWSSDTTGAFFFDARGDLSHGQEVQPIFNYQNASDQASWPDAAKVPANDRGSSTYFSLLQGQDEASQGDIWFLTWDGDPAFSAGRKHPLGVLVETRMMGWNYPAGNNDILYLVYTFYNVSSTCPADYAGVRPSMQSILLQQAAVFQAKNNAAFGITLPACGYTISKFFANFAADMDVTPDAGNNYASVNIPYQLGYVYSSYFAQNSSATGYPPDIDGPPFMGGYGFVGVKYLASPDSGTAPNKAPAGLSLFSDTENGGVFGDPGNAIQLYRYMSGTVSPSLGDGQCNHDPVASHICHVEVSAPNDMRFFQSSGPFDLPAGGSGSVVVAYIFASPVKFGPCQTAGSGAGAGACGNLNPGNPEALSSLDSLTAGNVNVVDHLTGFVSYAAGTETKPDQNHFVVVPGSLLGKANIAQLVFNNKFLLPFAPSSPDFFLVPGDNSVAVMWRPSSTEATGDLYYQIAHSAVTLDSVGNPTTIPNPLYDPNYRQFDVEGYRVYRGRNQGDLHLLAQFDKAGTVINDYNGQVNPVPTCAPELGINKTGIGADHTCNGKYNAIAAGVTQTKFVAHPLVGSIVQVILSSGRVALANGTALVTIADTAVTGTASGKFPALTDNGVPFTYVDNTALNNLRYFYAVTAFDVNSIQSGPSSLESPRVPKAAIPMHPASNYSSTYTVSPPVLEGRGVDLSTHVTVAQTIDPTTGEFSGPAQATSNWQIGLAGAVVPQVLQGPVSLSATMDSVTLGGSNAGLPATYWFSANGTPFAVSILQNFTEGTSSGATPFLGPSVNAHQSAFYGGNSSFKLGGQVKTGMVGLYQTLAYGRGCINGATGFTVAGATGCDFNGARWFNGPSPANNEATANPTAGNGANDAAASTANFSNAGSLTGVVNAYEPRSYQTMENLWRNVEGVLAGAAHAADYNL
ncbi:MAG TPA: hypothetical protein VFI39_01945, partial [Gemmatimonadales bacterium]|nr:hypothetical protein [Gemmatimonadales bacterium]